MANPVTHFEIHGRDGKKTQAFYASLFGWTVDDICGKSRRRPLVTARQTGMYVMRELTDLSYPAIAREFGGRDHTTVIHAVDKIGSLMAERRQIYDQVTELIHRIKGGQS